MRWISLLLVAVVAAGCVTQQSGESEEARWRRIDDERNARINSLVKQFESSGSLQDALKLNDEIRKLYDEAERDWISLSNWQELDRTRWGGGAYNYEATTNRTQELKIRYAQKRREQERRLELKKAELSMKQP